MTKLQEKSLSSQVQNILILQYWSPHFSNFLRLERDAWLVVQRLRRAVDEDPPPPPHLPSLFITACFDAHLLFPTPNIRAHTNTYMLLDGYAGDPRAARVHAILAACRLETESIRLFDQAPIAPLDLYHRRLRGQSAKIRQTATQTNEDDRSVETQTDEVRSIYSLHVLCDSLGAAARPHVYQPCSDRPLGIRLN